MEKVQLPEGLEAALKADGVALREVQETQPEVVVSVFVEQGSFGFTLTYQKTTGPGGKPVWLKLMDGRHAGDEE